MYATIHEASVPGDFHADNSELIQMLRKGHLGVKLPREAWDRFTTWIDLCVPYYGTWHELAGWKTVKHAGDRRRAMRKRYAGIDEDPEAVDAGEWTRSTYMPYPYRAGDGRNDPTPDGRKVVRGGSFHDRPVRCRSAYRLSYPPWRRVFNVGFRVFCPADALQ